MNMDTVNTNTNNTSSVVSHKDTIYQAVDIIEASIERLSINEIEKVMEKLEDLQTLITEVIISRIPGNRLSLVEGEWRVAVTINSGDTAEILTKYQSVFAASPLKALEGYAAQLLAETQMEIERCTIFATKPFHEEMADYYTQELARLTARRDSLEKVLTEIKRIMGIHGGNAVAAMAGLDSAVIESLVAFNQNDGE